MSAMTRDGKPRVLDLDLEEDNCPDDFTEYAKDYSVPPALVAHFKKTFCDYWDARELRQAFDDIADADPGDDLRYPGPQSDLDLLDEATSGWLAHQDGGCDCTQWAREMFMSDVDELLPAEPGEAVPHWWHLTEADGRNTWDYILTPGLDLDSLRDALSLKGETETASLTWDTETHVLEGRLDHCRIVLQPFAPERQSLVERVLEHNLAKSIYDDARLAKPLAGDDVEALESVLTTADAIEDLADADTVWVDMEDLLQLASNNQAWSPQTSEALAALIVSNRIASGGLQDALHAACAVTA